eukprot:2388538-Pleurochrysis_carterae.AAC.1
MRMQKDANTNGVKGMRIPESSYNAVKRHHAEEQNGERKQNALPPKGEWKCVRFFKQTRQNKKRKLGSERSVLMRLSNMLRFSLLLWERDAR